ncbi:MAG: exo-alpha-sialidase, partial [Acidimicrobiales bacterium]
MRRFAALSLPAFVALVVTAVGPAASQDDGGGTKPVVLDAVQVTADPSPIRAHTSPQIARNPKTGELVIVEGDVRGSRECKVHISTDDGRSWRPGGKPLDPPVDDCAFKADWGPYATMAFDNKGVLYMAVEASDRSAFVLNRPDVPRNIFLARSTDSGRTFESFKVFTAPENNPDKGINKGAAVAVDPKDPNHVYIGWRQGNFGAPTVQEKLKTMVAASADGGRTWGAPVDVTDSRGGDFPWLTVTPDGVVHAVTWVRVWPVPPTGQPNPVRELFHVSSADKGGTFSERHVIDPGNQQHEHPPVLASDARTGALYVAWSAQPDAMNQVPDYKADLEVYFRSSTDGGRTWSAKKTLNDDGLGKANQIDPGIAVAPNGRVDVAWYDSRLNPGPLAQRTETGFNDVYYTYSTDGGATFAPNLRVSDRSADRSIGVWANNIDQRLDVGVASSNDAAYVAWQDTRDANREFQPEDVYMTSVRLNGTVAVTATESSGTPAWLAVGAGLAIG